MTLYIDEEGAEAMGAMSACDEGAECPFSWGHPLGVAWRTGRAKALAFQLAIEENNNSCIYRSTPNAHTC